MIYGYTRVSTVEQAAGSSIEDQERRIKGAAMVRGDPEPVMFSDPGISGSVPLASRPAGAALLAALIKGDVLIAAKLDRLFRSASDALVVVEQFKRDGIDVVFTDLGTDSVTSGGSVGKLLFTIMAAIAELERERIAERTNDGRVSKRRRGGFTGGKVPYGYAVAGAGRDAALVPVADEQEVVAFARTWRDAGKSLRGTARALDQMGRRNRTGKRFDPTQIKRMLEFLPNGTTAP